MLDVFFFYNYAIVVECEYYPNIQYVLDQNKSTCEEVFQNESVWPITVFNIENVIATETSPVVILYMRGVDITCHEYLVKLMTSYNNESGYESGTCVFHTEDDMKSGIVKCIYTCTCLIPPCDNVSIQFINPNWPEYGDKLDLPVSGNAQTICEHTGQKYQLKDSQLSVIG